MKNLTRILVIAALLGWPTYEYVQYHHAKQALAASVDLKKSVDEKLTNVRIKYAQAGPQTTAVNR